MSCNSITYQYNLIIILHLILVFFFKLFVMVYEKNFVYILAFQTEENQQFSDDVHTIHTIYCQFSNKRK